MPVVVTLGEDIADTSLGEDESGVVGIVLKLLPEAGDIRLENIGLANIFITPDPVQYLVRGNHAVGIVGQIGEDFIFGRCQVYVLAIKSDLLAEEVDLQALTVKGWLW